MSADERLHAAEKASAALGAAQFERLIARASDAFFVVSLPDLRCVYATPQVERITGVPRESFCGDPLLCQRVVEPEHWPIVVESFRRLVEGERRVSAEFAVRDGSGDVRWVRGSATLVADGEGRFCAIECVLTDATEQRRLQTELAASEGRFARLFRTMPLPSTITGFDGTYLDVSDTFCELTGYTRDDVVGKNSIDLDIWVDHAERERMIHVFKEQGFVQGLEVRFRLKDASIVIVELSAKIIELDGRPVIFSVTRDLTPQRRAEAERHRMERHMERVQRLESLGVLAGGIAHDFNNMLTVISGNAALARQHLGVAASEGALHCLEEIRQAVMQAHHLTQQLRTFARGSTPQREVVVLDSIIRDAASFALTGSRHRCVFEIADDLWVVDADAGQLRQVVHNLVLNADEAMSRPGVIRVYAANVEEQGQPGVRWVKVSIVDDGPGIPPDVIPQIFEPFFTTKEGGTGLGLATSHSIIAAHGGRLELEPARDTTGSVFSFWLPAADCAALPARPKAAPARINRPLHILLLDDQAALLRVVTANLERQGHRVEAVRDGYGAVEAFKRSLDRRERFDIVIMDLTIPGGMGGLEALRLMKAMDSEVVAVAASGYSGDRVMSDPAAYGFAGTLSKPFQPTELDDAIAAALERRSV